MGSGNSKVTVPAILMHLSVKPDTLDARPILMQSHAEYIIHGVEDYEMITDVHAEMISDMQAPGG